MFIHKGKADIDIQTSTEEVLVKWDIFHHPTERVHYNVTIRHGNSIIHTSPVLNDVFTYRFEHLQLEYYKVYINIMLFLV